MDDKARRKAVLCPRRAGKSWTALSYAFDTALRKPGSVSLVICLTLKSAKAIYWHALVGKFVRSYGIQADMHHTDLRITLSNGSHISFTGAETKAEIDKIRGASYDLVVVDECKSYAPAVLHELIYDAVEPATDDRGGTILLIGTPGNILSGLFYEATSGALDETGRPYSKTFDEPEAFWDQNPKARVRWSRHTWTRKENDRTQENLWELALEKKENERWEDDHPTWQIEYLGRWVPAGDCFVYAYATLHQSQPDKVHWQPQVTRDNIAGLPDPQDGGWRYILGADLGYEDDFAAVVAAYSPHKGELFHVWDYKANHQDVYAVVQTLQYAWDRFGGFDAMVVDAAGLGKMVVETISSRHGLPVQAAEKTEKYDHIELLNADFHSGKVKLIPGSDLAREMSELQFDLSKHSKKELARTGKLRENPQLPNHLCDSFLYLHRFSNHYWSAPKQKQYTPGTSSWLELKEAEWVANHIEKRDNPDSLWDHLRKTSVDPLAAYRRR